MKEGKVHTIGEELYIDGVKDEFSRIIRKYGKYIVVAYKDNSFVVYDVLSNNPLSEFKAFKDVDSAVFFARKDIRVFFSSPIIQAVHTEDPYWLYERKQNPRFVIIDTFTMRVIADYDCTAYNYDSMHKKVRHTEELLKFVRG